MSQECRLFLIQSLANSTSQVINEDLVSTNLPPELIKGGTMGSVVVNEKHLDLPNSSNDVVSPIEAEYPSPTDQELVTLRKVPGSIPWITWLLCLVEFAERASYYGAKQVFANFLANPLPDGNIRIPYEQGLS